MKIWLNKKAGGNFIVVFLCLFLTTRCLGNELTALERQLENLAVTIDSVKAQGFKILGETENVAQKIQLIQSRSKLSRKEHQELEKQLQRAQTLEMQLQAIEMRIDTLYQAYLVYGKDLLVQYQAKTDKLLDQMETAVDPDQKAARLQQFQQLMSKKNRLDNILHPLRLNSYRPLSIESQPWDTPEDMKLKGDMLMDRSEMLQQEAWQIDQKITSLTREYKARKKAEEISEELDLFDRGESSVPQDVLSQSDESRNVLDDGVWGAEGLAPQETESGYQAEPWNPIRDDLSFLDTQGGTSRTSDSKSIQNIILQLRQRAGILRVQSDSLQSRARWFYSRAE